MMLDNQLNLGETLPKGQHALYQWYTLRNVATHGINALNTLQIWFAFMTGTAHCWPQPEASGRNSLETFT